jgi:hypothetical protein
MLASFNTHLAYFKLSYVLSQRRRLRSGVATEVHSLWNASGLIVTPERMEVSPVKDLKQIFCIKPVRKGREGLSTP